MLNMKSPYQKIVMAAKAGRGVRLSAKECFEMAMDTAIRDLAENDDERESVKTGD